MSAHENVTVDNQIYMDFADNNCKKEMISNLMSWLQIFSSKCHMAFASQSSNLQMYFWVEEKETFIKATMLLNLNELSRDCLTITMINSETFIPISFHELELFIETNDIAPKYTCHSGLWEEP